MEFEQRINNATPEQLRESLHQVARDVDDLDHMLYIGIENSYAARGISEVIYKINETIDDKLPKTEVNEPEQLVRQLMNQNRTSDFKKESNETVIAGIRIPNEELFEITPPVTHLDDGPAWPPPPEQSR